MIRFKLFGMTVRIEFMFVVMVTLFLLTDKSSLSIIALLACFLHELGHMLMFCLVGYRPLGISFEITGICIHKPKAQLSYKKEILVQLSGSAVNFIMFALLCGTINKITPVSIFAVMHLIVGCFNLLPIKSFDGGKLLEILLLRLVSPWAAELICDIADLFFILTMLLLSVFAFFSGHHNFTFIVLAVYLMLITVIKLKAG